MAVLPEKQVSTILGPDGTPVEKPMTRLSFEEAELLKAYQAYGNRENLSGAMVCADCGKDGEMYVQDGQIGFFCECRVLLWQAS